MWGNCLQYYELIYLKIKNIYSGDKSDQGTMNVRQGQSPCSPRPSSLNLKLSECYSDGIDMTNIDIDW